ncbi:MAG: alanine dehydrogenase, partial [Candidatus Tectomicrobia bacterium]|nr:alanine dehydrogenase [Candidatus Tectomicrobia bacterium]
MIVGVPREIKKDEHRAALSPGAVEALASAGHAVLIEKGAGLGAGIADREYREAGGRVVPAAEEVWGRAEMVVKVKEPLRAEHALMREGQTLFAFLHLAAAQPLARVLLRQRVRAIAFETVRTA